MAEDRFEKLYALAEAVNQARSTQEVFERTMDWLEGGFGLEAGALWLLGEDAVLRLVASRGMPMEEPDGAVRAASTEAGGCDLPASGEAPRQSDRAGLPALQCLISMPLFSASRLTGTLSMASVYRTRIDEELVGVFDALGGLLGSALERVADFEDMALERLQWETAINHMDELVSIHDPEMRIRKANPAVERHLGLKKGEILGRRCYELFHEDGRQHCCCPFGAAASTLRPQHADVEQQDGTILHVSVYPVVKNSTLQGVVHIARDVTEARMLGEHSRQIDKHGAIEGLVAGLAHDMKNPLYYASNYLFLLRKTVSDQKARGLVEKAEEGIRRARDVLEELVSSSRPEDPPLREVDLAAAAEEVVSFLSGEAESRSVRVASSVDPGIRVRAEGKRLYDSLVNIIKNAIEAGATEISLACQEKGEQVRLVVSDNGPGMGQESLRRVFEPYFTTKPGGSGLGLFMTYQNIRTLGGRIWCRSSEGSGTKLYVLLNKAF